VASLSQGRTAAAQCGLFTHKSVPVIFEPPCILDLLGSDYLSRIPQRHFLLVLCKNYSIVTSLSEQYFLLYV